MASVRIIDRSSDALALSYLASIGCIRSAHVGLLSPHNTTVAPLLAGMRVQLHEFLRHANSKDYDVCSHSIQDQSGQFKRIDISNDGSIWGPLANWNTAARDSIAQSRSNNAHLALVCASPFAFHLQATKLSFASCSLVSGSSSVLLNLGKNHQKKGVVITKILTSLAKTRQGKNCGTGGRPNAFYRVIDEHGRTFPLERLRTRSINGETCNLLEYENGFSIPLQDAPKNVLRTFFELDAQEANPSLILECRPRLVMDTAFYLVCSIVEKFLNSDEIVTHGERRVQAYHLCGNEMIRYLVTDKDLARQYQRQVDNTYIAIAAGLQLPTVAEFHLFRAAHVNGYDQYTAPLNACDPSAFIAGGHYSLQ